MDRRLCLLLAAAAALDLPGCVSPTPRADADLASLWRDSDFSPPTEPADARQALAISPAMREHVLHVLLPAARRLGTHQALLQALGGQGDLHLDYDASRTRTAAETFAARSGNCLSLLLMASALAGEMGMRVSYQEVLGESQWSRVANLHVASGHVNLAIGSPLSEQLRGADPRRRLTIDFLPDSDLAGQRVRPIDEARVLSMYLNNRAAEWLAEGDLDSAYAWARAALLQDPVHVAAHSTLAVIYLRHGDAEAAHQVLARGLHLAPDHPPLLANLALTWRRLGRPEEARRVEARLQAVEHDAPFRFFDLGQAALQAGDLPAARDWFLRELARDPDYHETRYALAVVEGRLGHPQEALRQLQRAGADSPRPDLRALYAAKADRLRATAGL